MKYIYIFQELLNKYVKNNIRSSSFAISLFIFWFVLIFTDDRQKERISSILFMPLYLNFRFCACLEKKD